MSMLNSSVQWMHVHAGMQHLHYLPRLRQPALPGTADMAGQQTNLREMRQPLEQLEGLQALRTRAKSLRHVSLYNSEVGQSAGTQIVSDATAVEQ